MLTSALHPSPLMMSSRSARLSRCTLIAEERKKNGRWAARIVQCGRVKAEFGRKTKVCLQVAREGNVCNDALHVTRLQGSGDKISLFLQDWELAKVALSCHMALDMLCQEMNEAW